MRKKFKEFYFKLGYPCFETFRCCGNHGQKEVVHKNFQECPIHRECGIRFLFYYCEGEVGLTLSDEAKAKIRRRLMRRKKWKLV